ncbi:porin family protein [Sphingobacterium daejeonense]|uniref:Porin family protein n=1 Tax=Sphingobacterium daejeonense TaxID=371142 RepID=A0ABW3RPW5_9SPHI
MKRILSSMAIGALSICALQAQTTYGLKAGMNLSKVSNLEDQKFNPSYFITGFADIPLSSQFSIQPGVSLQGKGAKFQSAGFNWDQTPMEDYKSTLNTMSIEIPVNAVYYVPVGNGKMFISAGPYLGYNISGKIKDSGPNGESERDVNFSGNDKNMNRLDAGLNFGLGYKLSNGILFQAGYGLGLSDLNASKNSKSFSNRTINFGVGFQF